MRYLQRVRPRCARREIFLTLKAPFRRLSQGTLYHLVSTRLRALGIQVPRRASQTLTGAMVQESFSGFCKRTATMPSHGSRILEQSFEHSRISF